LQPLAAAAVPDRARQRGGDGERLPREPADGRALPRHRDGRPSRQGQLAPALDHAADPPPGRPRLPPGTPPRGKAVSLTPGARPPRCDLVFAARSGRAPPDLTVNTRSHRRRAAPAPAPTAPPPPPAACPPCAGGTPPAGRPHPVRCGPAPAARCGTRPSRAGSAARTGTPARAGTDPAAHLGYRTAHAGARAAEGTSRAGPPSTGAAGACRRRAPPPSRRSRPRT